MNERQVWRVVDVGGVVHDVEIEPDGRGGWVHRGRYPSNRAAVTVSRAVLDGWCIHPVEIIAAGEPSRAELLSALRRWGPRCPACFRFASKEDPGAVGRNMCDEHAPASYQDAPHANIFRSLNSVREHA